MNAHMRFEICMYMYMTTNKFNAFKMHDPENNIKMHLCIPWKTSQ